jgi:NADPH2:quinone reductase
MKAVFVRAFVPFDQIEIDDIPEPQPSADEVVVDVVSAEANYPDILVIEGQYQTKPPLPFSPGKQVLDVCRRWERA